MRRSFDLRRMWQETPVTTVLIFLNLFVFILQYLMPVFGVNLYGYGVIEHIMVTELNQWYRIITAGFMHGDLIHFLSNVFFGLYILTTIFERLMGSKKTLFIYFTSMILSGILVVYTSEPWVPTLGASGAIFGILGSLLWITIYRKDLVHPQFARQIQSLIMMNVIITLLVAWISTAGHIGGLASGFLLSYLIIPRDKAEYDIYH